MATANKVKRDGQARGTQVRTGRAKRTRIATERILVASAGDRSSAGALRVAAAIAKRGDMPVLALAVSSAFPRSAGAVVSMRQPLTPNEEQRREVLHDLLRSVEGLPGSAAWTKRAVVGIPADAIVEMASKWRASLIILGLGRHSRLDRILGRETVIAVMRRARVPVLAVPAGAKDLPACALAAIDFTPASLASAAYAARFLAPEATLYTAHVRAFGGAKAEPGGLVDLYRAGAEAKLSEAALDLQRRTSRRIEPVMLEGEPGAALIRFGRQAHVDLIALGGHEQGLMDRILLGSVRTHVVREAGCSVLIAHPGARS